MPAGAVAFLTASCYDTVNLRNEEKAMKLFTKLLLCVLLTLSLTLSLCACGKGQEGTYTLTRITFDDGTVLDGKVLEEEMRDTYGIELSDNYITLNEDGTGIVCIYGFGQEIGYKNGKFWYLMDLDSGLYIDEDIMEFDEEGFPIEDTTPAEETEPTIPEEIQRDFTVSGKTITLDPEGIGEVMTFTKQ